MRIKFFLSTLVFFFFAMQTAAYALISPKFEDYAVKVKTTSKFQIDLQSHPDARQYRTRLTEAAKEKVNFAGHYILTSWGCGSNCLTIAIIDSVTGKVHFPKQLNTLTVGIAPLIEDEPLEFQKNSTLLVVKGAPGSENADSQNQTGVYYYLWESGALKLLK